MKIYSKILVALALTSMFAGCSKNRLKEDSSGVLTADLLFTS